MQQTLTLGAFAAPPSDAQRAGLLDLDPDLGNLLEPERREAARRQLTARVIAVATGEWDVSRLRNVDPLHVGLLVVDGVLAREVAFEDTVSTELLGPGDLIRPWQADGMSDLLPVAVRWNALSRVRIALLDRHVAVALAGWPEVNAVLMERVQTRAQRLAMAQAISHLHRVDRRLNALFWHLAERFGRVTSGGVVVPLALSHRLIGQLIGARRPTVSTALAALAQERRLVRLNDGTWLLPSPPESAPAPTALEVIRQRRRLIPVADAPRASQPVQGATAGIDHNAVQARLRALLDVTADRRREMGRLQEELDVARQRLDARRSARTGADGRPAPADRAAG